MENTPVFIATMILLPIALIVAFCILMKCIRKKFEFEDEETLIVYTKRASLIPVYLILAILISLLCTPLLQYFSIALVIIFMGVSIAIGLPSGLLGIAFSVVCIKRKLKGGVKYIIASSLSVLISLDFLWAFL